ncbi:MAG: lipoyl(octanoyl) transferase LipB [Gammaproteobacteria bacterium]|nr:lipoyl(octanoyl) transferase LipB [Gammaproteobacteria bacterium]
MIQVRDLGQRTYQDTFDAMKQLTALRGDATPDEIWLVEHEPVFTQGQAGKAEHLLAPGAIPVVQSDRGGQVTYHGPGQIVGYLMLDIRRAKLSPRGLVSAIEGAIIDLLAGYGIFAAARADAPGVYVGGDKIGSLGLRVRRGCSYHGLALNVDMDLEPFARINPCGLLNQRVTQIVDLDGPADLARIKRELVACLIARLGRTTDDVSWTAGAWRSPAAA